MIKWLLSKVLAVPMVQSQQRYERELRSDQIFDATRDCPTCGYNGNRIGLLTLQADPLVEYLECPNCRGCSTSWMPTPNYLAEYYNSYYAADETKVTFPSSVHRFAKHILDATLPGFSGSTLKILDFGGGDGAIAKQIAAILLKKCPTMRIKILVVDYVKPAPYARDNVEFDSVKCLAEVHHERYDLIVASAILEHIPDLRPTLRSLFSVSAPGGSIYIRVPWVLPLRTWLSTVPLLWPMHVHDLGPSFWNRLCDREALNAEVFRSRPPLSETEFRHHFLLTLISHVMKAPAKIELSLRQNPKDLFWKYVAGWEVVYRVH